MRAKLLRYAAAAAVGTLLGLLFFAVFRAVLDRYLPPAPPLPTATLVAPPVGPKGTARPAETAGPGPVALSPGDAETELRRLVEAALALPPGTVVVGRGQSPSGLDLARLLALTGQDRDRRAFTDAHRFFAKATQKLAATRKTWALCALLDHPNVDAKIYAARALKELADPASAPVLLAAAKQNNYPVSGSEEATLHSVYRRTLKEALEQITGRKLTPAGLRLTVLEPGRPEQVTSDEHPEYFAEEVDFAAVERWLRERYLGGVATQPPAAATGRLQVVVTCIGEDAGPMSLAVLDDANRPAGSITRGGSWSTETGVDHIDYGVTALAPGRYTVIASAGALRDFALVAVEAGRTVEARLTLDGRQPLPAM